MARPFEQIEAAIESIEERIIAMGAANIAQTAQLSSENWVQEPLDFDQK